MKVLVKALIGLLVMGSLAAQSAEIKIGYIDLQKAIQTTSAGKKAKAELESEFNKRKKDIEGKESDIKKMTEDMEKKKAVLSEEAMQKKQMEVQEEMMKYRELVGKNQVEIQKKERDLTAPILEKMRTIIDKMAKNDSYTVILEKNEQSVLWVKGDIDITEKVVAEFEKQK
jgi:outer membrane protein